METPHFIISPLVRVDDTQCLECVIVPGEWLPLSLKKSSKKVLIGEGEFCDLVVCREEMYDGVGELHGWVENYSP